MENYYININNTYHIIKGVNFGISSMMTENHKPITAKEYEFLHAGIIKGLHIWQKKTGELQLRGQNTKYDEINDNWVEDSELLAAHQETMSIAIAKAELEKTAHYDMPSFRSRLTAEENKGNDSYRAKLWDTIENKMGDNA